MENSILEDLCAVVGYNATCKLAAWFPGQRLYVPTRASESHPLALLIGMPALRALVREFAEDVRIFLPTECSYDLYRRDREIALRFSAGDSVTVVAKAFRLGERRVQQIRKELEEKGWLKYADGYRSAMREGRTAARRGTAAPVPGFLGTNEVFGESPLPP